MQQTRRDGETLWRPYVPRGTEETDDLKQSSDLAAKLLNVKAIISITFIEVLL